MKSIREGRFEEIDVLRGLAASCVVLSHYTSHCVRYFGESPFHVDLIYGYYAVQLFFIISGFVIYFTIEKSKTWKDFAFSRMSRLYPAYWATLTFVVAAQVLAFSDKMWWHGYLSNLTMLQEFLGYGNMDNVYWSLTVELVFYFAMAIFLVTGLIRHVQIVAAVWLTLACAWALFEKHLGIPLPAFLPRYLILPHVPFFMVGVMFYLIHTRGLTAMRAIIIFAALVAVGWIDGMASMGVAFVLISVFGLALAGYLSFLVSPVTLWMGTISYPLYLVHRNLGYAVLDRLHGDHVPIWTMLIVTIVGALMLGSLFTYLVERPASNFLRQWYRARKSKTA